MDNDETILLSASNIKEKNTKGTGGTGGYGVIVAQFTDNYYDPNEQKYNHPLTFDNDHSIAFSIANDDTSKRSIETKKSIG